MKTIKLRCHNIEVEIDVNKQGGGCITSDLHNDEFLEEREELFTGIRTEIEYLESKIQFEAAIDAIESMILAHACAGVDIESLSYIKGIELAIQSCDNSYL